LLGGAARGFQARELYYWRRFADFTVKAKITLDATELGDLLALAEIPYRWGWELQSEWGEHSAPTTLNTLTERYPVQAPTWVVIMQDFGEPGVPEIPAPPEDDSAEFTGAWDTDRSSFSTMGGCLGSFMINWPQCGNDYGEGVGRLIESEGSRRQFFQESRWHTQSFAFIQTQLGRRYGLANQVFLIPTSYSLSGGAYALHPYYRESRRLTV